MSDRWRLTSALLQSLLQRIATERRMAREQHHQEWRMSVVAVPQSRWYCGEAAVVPLACVLRECCWKPRRNKRQRDRGRCCRARLTKPQRQRQSTSETQKETSKSESQFCDIVGLWL